MLKKIKQLLMGYATTTKKKTTGDAREAIVRELFYDMYERRFSIYKINFVRGIFFGLGSVLGGTVVVAALVWVLNTTGALIPAFDGFTNTIAEKVKQD